MWVVTCHGLGSWLDQKGGGKGGTGIHFPQS